MAAATSDWAKFVDALCVIAPWTAAIDLVVAVFIQVSGVTAERIVYLLAGSTFVLSLPLLIGWTLAGFSMQRERAGFPSNRAAIAYAFSLDGYDRTSLIICWAAFFVALFVGLFDRPPTPQAVLAAAGFWFAGVTANFTRQWPPA